MYSIRHEILPVGWGSDPARKVVFTHPTLTPLPLQWAGLPRQVNIKACGIHNLNKTVDVSSLPASCIAPSRSMPASNQREFPGQYRLIPVCPTFKASGIFRDRDLPSSCGEQPRTVVVFHID